MLHLFDNLYRLTDEGAVSAAAAGKTTLVTVETDMTAWGAAASVSMDHQALGEALGTAALHGVPAGGTVLLLDSLPGDNGIRERLEAAREVLERAGRQVREYQWSGDETLFADILRIERPGAVIAFEAAALAEVAELSRGGERVLRRVSGGGGGGVAGAARGLDRCAHRGVFRGAAGDYVRERQPKAAVPRDMRRGGEETV